MKVSIDAPVERTLQIVATLEELVDLYNATRPGRKSKRHNRVLEEFGNLLGESDRELGARIVDLEAQSGAVDLEGQSGAISK